MSPVKFTSKQLQNAPCRKNRTGRRPRGSSQRGALFHCQLSWFGEACLIRQFLCLSFCELMHSSKTFSLSASKETGPHFAVRAYISLPQPYKICVLRGTFKQILLYGRPTKSATYHGSFPISLMSSSYCCYWFGIRGSI